MANEVRLIDGNKAKAVLVNMAEHLLEAGNPEMAGAVGYAAEVIGKQKNVEAVEVVHGRWIGEVGGYMWRQNCSICNGPVYNKMKPYYNHCPYCGARMDGDGNE